MAVQTPNALLPLAVRTAQPVSAFQASERLGVQNRATEAGIVESGRRVQAFDAAETERQNQAETIERFRNIESGVKQLSPLLDQVIAGQDPTQFMAGLEERRTQLVAEGRSTEDTDLAIQTAQSGNFGGVRQLFDQVLENGRQLDAAGLGITAQEQFTLGAGQTRFGPGGRPIAAGAQPTEPGFTLSPGQDRFDAAGNVIASGGVDPKTALDAQTRLTDQVAANLKTEEGLRKEVNSLLTDFFKVSDAFSRIQASVSDPSPAGDLSLIFNYMKMLDPGSTVRESEFAAAANASSLADALKNKFGKVFSGEILEFTREDFIDRSKKLFAAAQSQAQGTADNFTLIAQRAKVTVSNVIGEFQQRVPPTETAIEFLRANDTPENRQQFTDKFGVLPEGF